MKFDYQSYESLLNQIKKSGYHIGQYGEEHVGKEVLLRHDIDMSLEKARDMARLEYAFDPSIKATYLIMISSDCYNVFSVKCLRLIEDIISMGNEIGLHFDEMKYFSDESWDAGGVLEKIIFERDLLEKMIGSKVRIVSMHRPSEKTLNANLEIPGMINTYSREYFEQWKYLSDSYHRWREDVEEIIKEGRKQKLQILTHPFWYGDTAQSRNDTFRSYIYLGQSFRYRLIEDNILPPGVTLEQSMNNDPDGEML